MQKAIHDLIEQADSAMNAGRLADARDFLLKVLEIDAAQPRVLFFLASIFERLGQVDESEKALLDSLRLRESLDAYENLTRIQLAAHRYEAAEGTFERLVNFAPENPANFIKLTKIKALRNDNVGALQVIRRARSMAPRNSDFMLLYANLLSASQKSNTAAIEELRLFYKSVADEPALAVPILRRIAELSAFDSRQSMGLPVDSAVSWDDVCRWSVPAGLDDFKSGLYAELKKPKVRAQAISELGSIAISEMNWDEAEILFRRLRAVQSGRITDAVTFDRTVFAEIDGLNDDSIFAGLAPVVSILERKPSNTPSVYLASDPVYCERFTLSLLAQLRGKAPGLNAHVHILDGEEKDWERLANSIERVSDGEASVSAEASGAKAQYGDLAREYYAAMRYIRFYQHVKGSQRPHWIFDVDVEVNQDPRAKLSVLNEVDVALPGVPLMIEPWNKIRACLVGVSGTEAGINYARLVAAYIAYWKQRVGLRWGIDQMALFAAYSYLHRLNRAPRTTFLSSDMTALHAHSGNILTFSSGLRKYIQL